MRSITTPTNLCLILLLLLQQSTAQTTPSGCYLLPTIPPASFKSGSMVPEMCMQQCGPSQLALIAPTVENIWDFYCSCVSSVPVAAAAAAAASLLLECNVKCPGAAIPSQAPPCGGTFNGQISWSAYGNLAPGFGFIAPESGSDSVVVPSIRSETPSSVAATIQPTVTFTLVDEEGRPQQSITSFPESSPSVSATIITTAMEPGAGSSEGSSSEQPSEQLHPSSTSNSSTAPKANGAAIAPPPSNQDDGGNTSEKTSGVVPSIGFIAGGFIAAIVILAVGFTVMIQQRKPQLLPKGLGSHQYGDQTGLIHGPSSEVDLFDGDSVSSVCVPVQAVQTNVSFSKNDSPPVLLYGLASKSTTVDTLNAPEISFGSPSCTVALGAMPDTLKTALNSNETVSIATVPLNHHAGAGGSIRPSYYSGVSLYSQLSRLYRRSVGGSSVAASSLFMRGMARNMAGEEEGVRGVRQDVFYTQRRS
ncbi:hypothetical protein BJ741DRAFT_598652 [Chytriomyces cf. hyalinus JEL632]|nr:hypothetical protein BJ741DRAFT_598652 [Chytriomyces cf. hyalinus JEL632]